MNILYHKKFLKDLSSLPSGDRVRIEKYAFDHVTTLKAFDQLGAEKLHGFKFFYKVRFGNYRVGLPYENETVTFERVLHRKEIYRFFP